MPRPVVLAPSLILALIVLLIAPARAVALDAGPAATSGAGTGATVESLLTTILSVDDLPTGDSEVYFFRDTYQPGTT